MTAHDRTPPLIAVVGATGTGKSELGLRLAERLGGEIINADAMQFYRGMDIGTAKLSVAEREGVPHHLLDILDLVEEASVSDFQAQARALIDDIRGRGAVPILVGGSGLYVRATLDVLEFPGTDPEVRATLEAEAAARGLAPLRERLRAVDPVSAERLQDERRVIRALEVHQLTGRPFSAFMPTREYVQPALQLGLEADREVLKERLALRVHRMVEQGLQDEVRELETRGLREGKTAGRAIGYAQFLAVQDGTLTLAEAVEDTIVATRKFARRQLTWFRADPRIHWLDWTAPDLVEQALRRVEEEFPGSVA
ncbi:tRNA (adenosine(37)-N6)-dimethylallyltransferase MiaA [Arthrobacter woluwensis]|uniref:tRNA (adenosine(37)-N6)-dimethylallyltransferase MiaA n=1 Tax=Arthrobacter woluwensis TaxID=156980 RepID=UPI001AAE4CE7|nr:tRNA (adenosine(37)-N6)-dimethylallyltransferase MiaA [Arthrobacter woluwensis]QTF71049.1 tRNA (adenosine(37)-N6)-dimethylallyltransferase MiaA [Arthrobacter woluwensis]